MAGTILLAILRCLALAGVLVLPLSARCANEIRLTTGPDYPPLVDHTRADGGIATKLVLAIFSRMDRPVTLDWLPWARGFQSTRNGRYNATFPYFKTEEREKSFLYSDALLSMPTFMWQRRGDSLDFTNPASFIGRAVCVPLGFSSSLAARLTSLIARREVRIESPPRPDNCVQMLAAGRVDAVTGTDGEIMRLIDLGGLAEKLIRSPQPLEIRAYFLIAPKADPQAAQLIERFNLALARMKEDGSYARLMAQ